MFLKILDDKYINCYFIVLGFRPDNIAEMQF